MGKSYSTDSYKKSYNAEYVKSYAKNREQQALYNESIVQYNTVSKKIGTRSYSKSEKSTYDGLQTPAVETKDTVRAEGNNKPLRRPKSPNP